MIPRTAIPTLYAVGDGTGSWQTPAEPDWPQEQYYQGWENSRVGYSRRPSKPTFPGFFSRLRRRKENPGHLGGIYGCESVDDKSLATARTQLRVGGGYMERLPLACIKHGIVDYAEKWHYINRRDYDHYGIEKNSGNLFAWRGFYLHTIEPPYASAHMRSFLEKFGVPHILCVWGLGIDEELMNICGNSFKIYYSIDAPPLRVPPNVSRHFNLIMVGDERQRKNVYLAHPEIPCELLTTGPDFADIDTFCPLNTPKEFDLIYVACAESYKRHDILFNAMAALKNRRPVSCLCICGYGDLAGRFRERVKELGINVKIIGPPGVSYDKVNKYMNKARVGIVAGTEDGCPAIISEYMLAGLPVLANAELYCGLRFITPETGWVYTPENFSEGIVRALNEYQNIRPRQFAIEQCGWPTSVRRFAALLTKYGYRR